MSYSTTAANEYGLHRNDAVFSHVDCIAVHSELNPKKTLKFTLAPDTFVAGNINKAFALVCSTGVGTIPQGAIIEKWDIRTNADVDPTLNLVLGYIDSVLTTPDAIGMASGRIATAADPLTGAV